MNQAAIYTIRLDFILCYFYGFEFCGRVLWTK